MNQMQCPNDDHLSAFLEGELTSEEVSQINAHLESCTRCQAALDAATESQLAVGLPVDPADDPTISNLVSRLSLLSPAKLEGDTSVTLSGIQFPGPATDEAPLGELGEYRIKELIGDGASGLLYRAVDPRIDREVAIKVLRSELAGQDESRQRLNREARAVAGLVHENVVQLYEFGNAPGFPPYLVMEMVHGESLGQRLKRVDCITSREAVDMVVPIAHALAAAHKQNLIHRDVKPSNILLDQHDKPRITDFGLALLDDGNTELTREGSLAGTPAYISPEQIIDPHHVDGRSDVYSLGVVLYQMLTGELPFQGVVRMTLLAVLHKDPPQPRQFNDEIPKDLETIVLKAMSKDPDKRYQTADTFADDLQRWRDGKPIKARPVGRVERFTQWCRRNPGTAALSTAVAVLLLTVTVGSLIASVNLANARSKAQQAATLAESQRDKAFSTLNRLVYEVNEKFEDDVTDIDQIQKTVLDISVRGLRDMASTADDAGNVDVSTAAAHIRLGMVLTRLENDTEARTHFDKGDEILGRLGGDSSSQWPVLRHMVELKWYRSDLAYNEDDFGESTALLVEAAELAETAFKRWPENFEAHMTLALAQSRLADHSFEEESDGAEEIIRKALDTLVELEKQYPDNSDVFLETTNIVDTMAAQYYSTDQPASALVHFKELIRRCNTALAKDPETSRCSDWLILAHHVCADIQKELGKKDVAIQHLVDAMAAQDKFEHWLDFNVIQAIQRDLDELRPPGD